MNSNQSNVLSVLHHLVKACVIAPPVKTSTKKEKETSAEKYVELKRTNLNSIFLRMNQIVSDPKNVEQPNDVEQNNSQL